MSLKVFHDCIVDEMVSPKLWIFFHLSLIAVSLGYDLGVKNTYHYETSVVINEECIETERGDLTGHRLRAKIELSTIWQDPQNPEHKLLKIQVSGIKLLVSKKSGFEERKSKLEKVPSSESYFLYKNNRVGNFWDNPSEHFVLRNLKRSAASLLQVTRKDGEEKLVDVSGECDVFYKVEGNTIRRSKRRCHHPVEDTVLSQAYGVRSSSLQHSTGIDCTMKDDISSIISKCLVNEHVKTFSNLWQRASICVQSTSTFALESTTESKEVFKNEDYNDVIEELKKRGELVEGNLVAVTKAKEERSASNIADSIKSFQESLKQTNLAKLKSASAFFKLLPVFRSASTEDILKVLENKKFENILPQILDLVAASSTPNSVEAALSSFGKVKSYDENLERYLISLSVLPRPESFVLKEIKAALEKGNHHEKIEAALINTLGALLKTYAKNEKADSKVVEDVLTYLKTSLKKCKNDDCILRHLRGLRNAAQPQSVPLLLQYTLKGGKPSLEALLAVRNMPHSQLSDESQKLLQGVFRQVNVKQDRSSRAIAAEILLKRNPSHDVLVSLLGLLSDQSDEEFSTFAVSKVVQLMEENEELRSQVLKILSKKEVSHYYSLAQKGKSHLFKSEFLSTNGLNVTYGIGMELLKGGLLKRSSFDVDLESTAGISNLLSIGMFAEGMGSFVGESSEEDSSDPTAGMELTLFGASLRPYLFFSSTSELMSHAWSGTASEPTPALQGIFALSDDIQMVILHNGMAARLELRGSMSIDLSASIQISLWYKSSQSQVKNAAATLVKGAAIVDIDFAVARGEYLYYGTSAIDFNTDLEFAETPYKMCLQMEHPNVVLRHDFQRSVEVTETKFSLKKTKKRKRFIPSQSYALHRNNNELCRIMKSSENY